MKTSAIILFATFATLLAISTHSVPITTTIRDEDDGYGDDDHYDDRVVRTKMKRTVRDDDDGFGDDD